MNGYDLYRRALALLGYLDRDGAAADEEHLLRRAGDALVELCADLGVPPPAVFTDRLTASAQALEALPYGMAMLLALSEGDAESNHFFCGLYNAKRAAAKAARGQIRDVLPRDDGGVTV